MSKKSLVILVALSLSLGACKANVRNAGGEIEVNEWPGGPKGASQSPLPYPGDENPVPSVPPVSAPVNQTPADPAPAPPVEGNTAMPIVALCALQAGQEVALRESANVWRVPDIANRANKTHQGVKPGTVFVIQAGGHVVAQANANFAYPSYWFPVVAKSDPAMTGWVWQGEFKGCAREG
jgi:hypothetical protein